MIMPTYNVQKARPPDDIDEFVRIPRRRVVVLEALALAVSTVLLAVNTVFSMYSWWGDDVGALGMGEGTREGLTTSQFATPFSPAPWTFTAWIAVFAMQYACLIYAWSFTCRQKMQRTISPALYPLFWVVNCVHFGYVYAVGHLANEISLALIAAEAVFTWISVAVVAFHLRRVATGLGEIKCTDKWATHLVTLNGLVFYGAWATLSVMFHVASVLKEDSDLHSDTIATCLLSLLAACTVSYFLLEATILDRYLRYVLVVYPAVMWWLGGILDEQWNNEFSTISRNDLVAFVLLLVVGGLFLVRLVLIVVFGCVRPLVGGGGREDVDGIAFIPY